MGRGRDGAGSCWGVGGRGVDLASSVGLAEELGGREKDATGRFNWRKSGDKV